MEYGLYEKILGRISKIKLEKENHKKIRNIDKLNKTIGMMKNLELLSQRMKPIKKIKRISRNEGKV